MAVTVYDTASIWRFCRVFRIIKFPEGICTMADHTAGYAAYTLVPDNLRILSIEFKINFFKPAYGHTLKCKSEVISQGKQIIVAQSTVFDVRDTHEKMVSKSTITLMVLDAAKLDQKK